MLINRDIWFDDHHNHSLTWSHSSCRTPFMSRNVTPSFQGKKEVSGNVSKLLQQNDLLPPNGTRFNWLLAGAPCFSKSEEFVLFSSLLYRHVPNRIPFLYHQIFPKMRCFPQRKQITKLIQQFIQQHVFLHHLLVEYISAYNSYKS